MDDEAKEAYMADLETNDKGEERFRGIDAHNPMPGAPEGAVPWIAKIYGDPQ